MRRTIPGLLTGAVLLTSVSSAVAAELVASEGDWTVYRHGIGDMLMCFAMVGAERAAPADGERQRPYLYVTTWPRAGIAAEVSLVLAGPQATGEDVLVEVGAASFELVADGDRAYVADPEAEKRLVEAMKRGRSLTAQARGSAPFKETFSLIGTTAAVQAMVGACP